MLLTKIRLNTNRFLRNMPIVGNSNSTQQHLLFEIEEPFNDYYNKGLRISNTPDRGVKRRARFYNLVQLLKSVNDIDGLVVECGCWKGLSSYLMSQYMRDISAAFNGADFYILDSFEGLSDPNEQDKITAKLVDVVGNRQNTFFKKAGAYDASLEHVKNVLIEFPHIQYHKGWLPQSLDTLVIPKAIKFLHIDLDLYEPILGTLQKLYPHVASGGIVVCDDYGSLFWPGAKKAVEEFAQMAGVKFIALSSGQAIFIKN